MGSKQQSDGDERTLARGSFNHYSAFQQGYPVVNGLEANALDSLLARRIRTPLSGDAFAVVLGFNIHVVFIPVHFYIGPY